MRLFFEVIRQASGPYIASCHEADIYTEGHNLEDLHGAISQAIELRFTGQPKPDPKAVHLILYHE